MTEETKARFTIPIEEHNHNRRHLLSQGAMYLGEVIERVCPACHARRMALNALEAAMLHAIDALPRAELDRGPFGNSVDGT